MKSLISIIKRCLNALFWSLGLSSVVLVLMLGFYICWTKPLSKNVNIELAQKTVKVQPAPKISLHTYAGM